MDAEVRQLYGIVARASLLVLFDEACHGLEAICTAVGQDGDVTEVPHARP